MTPAHPLPEADRLPCPVLLTDADGRVLAANAELLALLRTTARRCVGLPLADLMPPMGGLSLRSHALPRLQREGLLREAQLQLLTRDGQVVPVLANVRRDVHGGQGAFVWVLFVVQERQRLESDLIHQRNAADGAVRSMVDSERFLRAVTDAIPGMVSYWDSGLRCRFANQSYERWLGVHPSEMLGRPMADLLGDTLRAQKLPLMQRALLGQPQRFECRLTRADGRQMDTLVHLVPDRVGDEVRGVFVELSDVTGLKRAEQALQREHERLRHLIDGTHAGTWEWNVRTGELIVNERWAAILGWTLDELGPLTQAFRVDIAHPDELQSTRQRLREHFAGRSAHYVAELRLRHRDGHWVWVEDRGRLITRGADGEPEWVYGIHLDIGERKRRDQAMDQLRADLAQQHELLRVTLQAIGDAVITTDAQGQVQWLNPAAERLTGWLSDEAHGRPLSQVFHIVQADSRVPARDPVRACLRAGQPVPRGTQTVLIARSGAEHGVEESAAPIRGRDGQVLGAVLVFHDVSEQRRLSGEMTWRATHDALTGLVNRAEFQLRLQRALDHARQHEGRHVLLYVDLDQFKLVNDSCGHAVGDQLLQQVARLLTDTVRHRDTLARLGGDEFGMILEHCSTEQATRVAQKLCDRMEDFRFSHGERRFRIGTSIGLVPIDRRWPDTAALQQAADAACYAAKEAGRNRLHIWLDSDAALRHRHQEVQWTARIEQALDHGHFELHAQRITGLAEADEGVQAEVLLRLREPGGELVPPGAFLPAAERFHLVARVDRWVLRHTVAWLQGLPDAAPVRSLSINLSGQSLGDRAFQNWAIDLLLGAGPAICRRLCLEITETAAVTNLADAAHFIGQLRAAGVRLALDDFGAGAASFGYLKSLPVDVLKIDGQFVRDLVRDPLDEAAVRCFTDVARLLGLKTVAECVEEPAVLERLREMGVGHAQGFLLHRPEPLAALVGQPAATRH